MKGLAKDLARLVARERVRVAPEDLFAYASDATKHLAEGTPEAVVLPETTDEVSGILKYAFQHTIPVTPRGAGSGLSGGCTPVDGGIVLDMKRMDKILDINRGNMSASVESGVVLSTLHKAVEKQGLFYPPNPQSMTVCTLGGNVATRACGPHGVKYGATGDYVLGLEVVLPDGSVITPGGMTARNSTGYDLTRLFTGSEGTLGVITQATFRLLALPPAHRTAVIICETVDQAIKTVTEIVAGGTPPAMIEYLPQAAVMAMNNFIAKPLSTEGQAYLLLDLDGSQDEIAAQAAHLKMLCREMGVIDLVVIEDEKEAASYWEARSKLFAMALTMMKKIITEDIAVPRHRIPDFAREIQKISDSRINVIVSLAGHAGDGNMHPSVVFPEINEKSEKEARETIELIVKAGLALGGTISGEHGIGLLKAEFLAWELGDVQVALLKRIKKAFDPKGIMNPGKIWKRGR